MLWSVAGVYAIRNLSNGKVYVGSSCNTSRRIHRHKHELRANIHPNILLQRSYNKYGEATFEFYVIIEVASVVGRLNPDYNASLRDNLVACEQEHIEVLLSYDRNHGYNQNRQAGSSLGRILSSTTKEQIGRSLRNSDRLRQHHERQRGQPRPQEVRERIRASLLARNYKHSAEELARMSERMKHRLPWNTGLTKETDERVAEHAGKLSRVVKDRFATMSDEDMSAFRESCRKGHAVSRTN